MALRLWINHPRHLGSVHDLIHDWMFDSEEIRLDPESSTLSIPFQRGDEEREEVIPGLWGRRRKRPSMVQSYLRIHQAEDYSIRDTEHIRFYDFNILEYHAETRSLRILTGIPIEIQVKAKGFEISVEVTDQIVEDYKTLVSKVKEA